tara:strand:+ start:568 stop:936 length:369 start_codon:yes stop_codon:yes gene_type:complete
MTDMEKCKDCPECGCDQFAHKDELGEGFRVCTECRQEWYTTINYKKYSSPAYYYEAFTQLGRELPERDRNGDANNFDKRSIKRRIRKQINRGFTVTAFVTKQGKREMIYSNWPVNAMNAIGI